MVQQVLVPVFVIESDEDGRQYYAYVNESDYPGDNRFNVGDKVRLDYEEFAESPISIQLNL